MPRATLSKITPGAQILDIFGAQLELGNRSLNAVSGAGPIIGDEFAVSLDRGSRTGRFTWHKNVAGAAFTALQVDLEGSIDGVEWFQLDTDTSLVDSLRHVVNKFVHFVRARYVSATGGGTVTVFIQED